MGSGIRKGIFCYQRKFSQGQSIHKLLGSSPSLCQRYDAFPREGYSPVTSTLEKTPFHLVSNFRNGRQGKNNNELNIAVEIT